MAIKKDAPIDSPLSETTEATSDAPIATTEPITEDATVVPTATVEPVAPVMPITDSSLVTVSTGDMATTSVYVGSHSVDFVDGSATVSAEIATLLKDAGIGV